MEKKTKLYFHTKNKIKKHSKWLKDLNMKTNPSKIIRIQYRKNN